MDKEKNLFNKLKFFFSIKKNRTVFQLILGSGVFVGAMLNISFGLPLYNPQGIIGAIVALFIIYTMS